MLVHIGGNSIFLMLCMNVYPVIVKQCIMKRHTLFLLRREKMPDQINWEFLDEYDI